LVGFDELRRGPVFLDGFESGDTVMRNATTP